MVVMEEGRLHSGGRPGKRYPPLDRPPRSVEFNHLGLVSGLWSVLADGRDTFPGWRPVVSRCDLNSTTVAGAAPDFDRLPNSPPRRHEAAPEMSSSNHGSDRDIGMKATLYPCGTTRVEKHSRWRLRG